MSKFTIKVKLQGLEIEVEGTKEDAPKIYQELGKQVGGLLQSPAVLASGNGNAVLEGDVVAADGAGAVRKPRKPKKAGGRTPAETINLTHDAATYGNPQQGWTQIQKAIWFLYVAKKEANVEQMTAYNIAKNFNKFFRAAGTIHDGNVGQGLEKEKVKGQNATVNADMGDGTAKYFLTDAGTTLAVKLARGEAVAAAAGE